MSVLILTNDQGNQVALCNKIAQKATVLGVVISKNIPKKSLGYKKRIQLTLNSLSNRIIGKEFIDVWFKMLKDYKTLYPEFPTENLINVQNVNDYKTIEAIEKFKPKLVVVSGTNLVGKKVIEVSQKYGAIINLHTGISPYVKGGPNCTNWCLANNWFHLIGNTIMWIDLGIDTGNIISTEQTKLTGKETLFELHWKVMEHAHDLYIRAITKILLGEKMLSVAQKSINEGNHFYSVDWNLFQIRKAINNYKNNYKKFFSDETKFENKSQDLELFPLC